jgi:hypothetical protein
MVVAGRCRRVGCRRVRACRVRACLVRGLRVQGGLRRSPRSRRRRPAVGRVAGRGRPRARRPGKLARPVRGVPGWPRGGAALAGARPEAGPRAEPLAWEAARPLTWRAGIVSRSLVSLALVSRSPGPRCWPRRPRVPGGLWLARLLSRHRPAGERTSGRPGHGLARVPRVVLDGVPVPVPWLRAIGRRGAAGVSASRHGAFLPAETVTGESRIGETRIGETRVREGGVDRATAEALHAMRARPTPLRAGVRENSWLDSCPRGTWCSGETWRSRLTGPGSPAGLRSASVPDVMTVARVAAWPAAAFPLAGLAVPSPGLGLRSPAPSPRENCHDNDRKHRCDRRQPAPRNRTSRSVHLGARPASAPRTDRGRPCPSQRATAHLRCRARLLSGLRDSCHSAPRMSPERATQCPPAP